MVCDFLKTTYFRITNWENRLKENIVPDKEVQKWHSFTLHVQDLAPMFFFLIVAVNFIIKLPLFRSAIMWIDRLSVANFA